MSDIEVTEEGDAMVVSLPNVVDATVVRTVRALLAGAVGVEGISTIEVDLRNVTTSEPELAAAIAEVRRRLHGSGQTVTVRSSEAG